MFLRFAAVAILAMSLLATAGSAQTAAELFQKGIYTQQTAGDTDSAIKIYQQVIAMAGADRALAGRAQMQLVSAFLQKGDFPGAAREFDTLALSYGDQKEVLAAMTTVMKLAASIGSPRPTGAQGLSSAPRLSMGTLENGLYHHTATGTEFRIPPGWSITGDGPSSGGGEAVMFREGSGQSYFVWLIANPQKLADIPIALDQDVEYKLHQRTVDAVDGFKMRPGTLFKWGAGTRQGISVAFEFNQNGPQIEYDTWMRSDKNLLYFRAICPASNITMVQDSLHLLTEATTVP
jgi:hypothetical protein